MDTLTHSLLGALVVRAAFPASRSKHPFTDGQRMLAGAIAGAFPDIDYLAAWLDYLVYLTHWHRGITHSLVMLPLWALLIGLVLSAAYRRRDQWAFLSLLSGLALLSHILSDLITVYGTQVFAPLSDWRASVGVTFVIDPWFSLIVLIGVICGLKFASNRLPVAFLVVLLAYVGVQSWLKQQALAIAKDHAIREQLRAVELVAFPQPFSPFNWKLLVVTPEFYDIAYMSLSGGYAVDESATDFWSRVRQTYRAPEQVRWQRQRLFGAPGTEAEQAESLWHDEQLDNFRRFAKYPVLYRIDADRESRCIWFTDVRYVLPYLTPPFRYGLCRQTHSHSWTLKRLE